MGLVVLIIVLAVLFGVIGLVVSALKWLLVIALVLLAFGVVRGMAARKSST